MLLGGHPLSATDGSTMILFTSSAGVRAHTARPALSAPRPASRATPVVMGGSDSPSDGRRGLLSTAVIAAGSFVIGETVGEIELADEGASTVSAPRRAPAPPAVAPAAVPAPPPPLAVPPPPPPPQTELAPASSAVPAPNLGLLGVSFAVPAAVAYGVSQRLGDEFEETAQAAGDVVSKSATAETTYSEVAEAAAAAAAAAAADEGEGTPGRSATDIFFAETTAGLAAVGGGLDSLQESQVRCSLSGGFAHTRRTHATPARAGCRRPDSHAAPNPRCGPLHNLSTSPPLSPHAPTSPPPLSSDPARCGCHPLAPLGLPPLSTAGAATP